MQTKQKRMTRQKRVIYDVLCGTTSHPTADWIYEQARKQVPDISLGTVYRNLSAMSRDGLILQLSCGQDQRRYDGCVLPHYHFICQKCGRVLDFPADSPAVDQQLLAQAPGLVSEYRLECYGVCADCQAQQRQ